MKGPSLTHVLAKALNALGLGAVGEVMDERHKGRRTRAATGAHEGVDCSSAPSAPSPLREEHRQAACSRHCGACYGHCKRLGSSHKPVSVGHGYYSLDIFHVLVS